MHDIAVNIAFTSLLLIIFTYGWMCITGDWRNETNILASTSALIFELIVFFVSVLLIIWL